MSADRTHRQTIARVRSLPDQKYESKSRKIRPPDIRRGKKINKLRSDSHRAEALKVVCCKKRCCRTLFTIDDVAKARKDIEFGNELEVTQAVAAKLLPRKYELLNKTVCSKAFITILGISRSKLARAHFLKKGGPTFVKPTQIRAAPKTSFVFQVLDDLFREVYGRCIPSRRSSALAFADVRPVKRDHPARSRGLEAVK